MKRPIPVPRQSGFTLLELLIALAIFSLMSVMAYGGLTAVIQTRTTVNASMQRLAMLQRTAHRLQTDIESAQARPVRNEYGDTEPAMALDLNERGLMFTRSGWRNPLLVSRSAMQRVEYRLDEDRLVRKSWPMLDRANEEGAQETIMLQDIEELRWRFLAVAPSAETQALEDLEWLEHWPRIAEDTATAELPHAVELKLKTKDWGEIRFLYRLAPGMPVLAGQVPNPSD